MSYDQIGWQNKPSTATPINATNLNHMDAGIAANDAAIGTLNTAVQGKVDKVEGKGLSTNDFTDEDALKLAGIEDGAEVNVQADWGQTDNTADDYIKNKPDLSVYAEKDALWQDATATGNPVTIKTQSEQAAKQTILTMLPVQDLHGYSKPWAAGQGINKWSLGDLTQQTQTGVSLSLAAGTYTFSATRSRISVNLSMRFNHADSTSEVVSFTTFSGQTFTLSADCVSINYTIANYQSGDSITEIQIESGSTAHSYAPYSNVCPISGRTDVSVIVKDSDDETQFSVGIAFGQTVYGGTLDVETGELTITDVTATIDGTSVSSVNSSSGTDSMGGKRIDTNISGAYYAGSGSGDIAKIVADSLETVSSTAIFNGNPQPNTVSISGANIVVLRCKGINTKADAETEFTNNPIQVCFKLATPTTATLTAAQVALIKGINNVSTDADSLTITYFNDGESLTDADNRITGVLGDFAKVEGARASQNYSVGDYLIFSDKFCKASAAIATGEALAIGTNLTQTTIGAELKAILAQL